MRRLRPWVLLLVAAGTSSVLLLVLGAGLTFFGDDWGLVLHRRGFTADAFLRPAHENIAIVQIALYKALLAVFGLESTLPYQLVAIVVLCVAAALLFAYLRRCVGDWLALVGCVIVLFLGAAWEVLLWPLSGVQWAGSTAAGIGMLLALQRRDRRGDALACGLLVLAIAWWSLGIAFLAGAATDVALRRAQWRSRAYVVAVPAALLALWYLGWGQEVEHAVSLDNLATTPRFVFDALGSSIASVLGLFAFRASVRESTLGRSLLFGGGILMLTGLALAGCWIPRTRTPSTARPPRTFHWLWVVAAVALAFWILAGLNQIPDRSPTTSRYQYPGAVLLLMAVAEALRGARIGPRPKIAVSALAAVAVVGNLFALLDGQRFFQRDSDLARAELGALEIARDRTDPAFTLAPGVSSSRHLVIVDAGSYYAAIDEFGSPAHDPAELARAPESARVAADSVLAQALRISLKSPAGQGAAAAVQPGATDEPRDPCRTLEPGAPDQPPLRLFPGRAFLHVTAGGPAQVRLRRFAADSFPVLVGAVSGNSLATLDIPRDRAARPWRLRIDASQPVSVCSRRSPG